MEGVVKGVPVPNNTPEAEYQLIVPAEAVALNTTVPVPFLEPGVTPVIVGVGNGSWLTVTALPMTPPLTITAPPDEEHDPTPQVTVTVLPDLLMLDTGPEK
jgi:hypothetical protein